MEEEEEEEEEEERWSPTLAIYYDSITHDRLHYATLDVSISSGECLSFARERRWNTVDGTPPLPLHPPLSLSLPHPPPSSMLPVARPTGGTRVNLNAPAFEG